MSGFLLNFNHTNKKHLLIEVFLLQLNSYNVNNDIENNKLRLHLLYKEDLTITRGIHNK